MKFYLGIIVITVLFISCEKHPVKNDRYVDKNSREIITISGYGKGYDLLFSDTSYSKIPAYYNSQDSAKECVLWIDSAYSSLTRVIKPIAEFDSNYVVLSDKIKLHPRRDDWYENLETRERVKIYKVGKGIELIESTFKLKEGLEHIIPMIVLIKGDSERVANSFGVIVEKSEVYRYMPISTYSIYQESAFEKDYKLIQ
ncbi:MAG: hypothetical protein HYV29_13100 [Ignavibacteriales bacterium]|nr:hypothetical protein [Ignavibacteriales bacterium]